MSFGRRNLCWTGACNEVSNDALALYGVDLHLSVLNSVIFHNSLTSINLPLRKLKLMYIRSQPRRLPTARLTQPSSLSVLSPLSTSMTLPLPSPNSQKQSFLSLAPVLFEFCRLLSIVPACYGTLWNMYHVMRPPNHSWGWSAEYAVSMLWVSYRLHERD